MRVELCQALMEYVGDPAFVFLTGDLGFQSLEALQEALGTRFINAGVAEQNMVSVAAGLAQSGLQPWVYSIAPFLYARPYEQIRNDICMHRLPVRLVGNGGGYAYGVMGGTHHALEDYGALLCLPGIRAYVPAFNEDIPSMVKHLFYESDKPAYLRLGRDEKPEGYLAPAYAPWRRLLSGGGPTMVAVGPLAGGLIAPLRVLPFEQRPELWCVTELPIEADALPDEFLVHLHRSQHLFVVEEHVAQGGAGQMLAHRLLLLGASPMRFSHRAALGYVSGNYGSQTFHRRECGLDAESLCAALAVLSDHEIVVTAQREFVPARAY